MAGREGERELISDGVLVDPAVFHDDNQVLPCRVWQVVAHCHSCQIAVCRLTEIRAFGLGDAFYMISEAKMHRLIVIRRIPADHSQ